MIIDEKNINNISFDNKLICGETLSILKEIPNDYVQTIVTSPSYFLGKSYEKSYTFENYLEEHRDILNECKRVLKPNGAIFWNVAQTVVNKEIIPLGPFFYDIIKSLDFYMKNWIIWKFEGGETPRTRLFGRYENILWFVKNNNDYIFNLDDVRIPSKWVNDKRCNDLGKNPEDYWVFDERKNIEKVQEILSKLKKFKGLIQTNSKDYVNQILMDELLRDTESILDSTITSKDSLINKNLNDNIWHINRVVNVSKKEKIKHPETGEAHPCPFPEELIKRIIKMSTNKNDLVLDIFNGSGTVCKVANDLDRKWIGIDKEMKYCEIAEFRINNSMSSQTSIPGT